MIKLLIEKFPILKSHFEFTTSLSLTTCENRLKDIGASIREAAPIGKRKATTFSLSHLDQSFLKKPALYGELQEIENGTLVKANFYPQRFFYNYALFIIWLIYSLYTQNYGFVFLAVVAALINTAFIICYRLPWDDLEKEIFNSLKHWKKG